MCLSKFYYRCALLIVGTSFLSLLSIPLVKADAIQLSLASKHLTNNKFDYNEFNPGLIVSKNLTVLDEGAGYVMAGYYRNSFHRNTFLAGIGWREGVFGLESGIVTGYSMKVAPMISPYIQYEVAKMNIIPIVSHKARFDGIALGFSLNFEVNKVLGRGYSPRF